MPEVKQKPQLHASWIDHSAKEIVKTLQKEGFLTYLVGGCVRDLLAGIHPKDFDIATYAEPSQIRRKVYGAYIIGKRFRLVLVKRGDQQFEVATFRRESKPEDFEEGEEPTSVDNFFGTPEQDALRRDFTINALFYDPIKNELVDYAEGMKDIQARVMRTIGDPTTRIIEDPIRSLRAIRLSQKLNFRIEESFRTAIQANAGELARSVLPRRREEYLKILRLAEPNRAFLEMFDLGLLHTVLPSLIPVMEDPDRREILLQYLKRVPDFVADHSQTVELYTPLVLGFLHATQNLSGSENLLDQLIRIELGMFKAEQTLILAALDLTKALPDPDLFLRKGLRRREAFLRQEGFDLTLKIIHFEKSLPTDVFWFWQKQMEDN